MKNTQLWISPRGKQLSMGMANIYPAELLWLVFGIQIVILSRIIYWKQLYTHNYNYVYHWGTAVRIHIIHRGTSHDLACWLHTIMYIVLYLSRSSRSRVMGQVLSMCYWWKIHSDRARSSLKWVGMFWFGTHIYYTIQPRHSCPSLTCCTCLPPEGGACSGRE